MRHDWRVCVAGKEKFRPPPSTKPCSSRSADLSEGATGWPLASAPATTMRRNMHRGRGRPPTTCLAACQAPSPARQADLPERAKDGTGNAKSPGARKLDGACAKILGGDLLSHMMICSIIGDKELNCRVRNGIGCTLLSMAAKKSL